MVAGSNPAGIANVFKELFAILNFIAIAHPPSVFGYCVKDLTATQTSDSKLFVNRIELVWLGREQLIAINLARAELIKQLTRRVETLEAGPRADGARARRIFIEAPERIFGGTG